MPTATDSVTWRYRLFDIDYLTQVFDFILLYNGADTVANGNTYHQLFSRTCRQSGAVGFDPPIVPVEASFPDTYYGAVRESGKQVFLLDGTSEQMIFDFNAGVGDSIPAETGKDMVTAIDSVMLGGVYHKRYLTTDTSFYVIEGVGSNIGLIPALFDGTPDIAFFCFNYPPVTYSPDTTIPCTYIYPVGYTASEPVINSALSAIAIYPVPATDVLHIAVPENTVLPATILNYVGQVVWSGMINEQLDISVVAWPRGFYYLRIEDAGTGFVVKKIVVE